MSIRFILAAHMALLCTLLSLNTGCSNKKSAEANDPELLDNAAVTNVTDEQGNAVSGSRFEDMYKRVEGITFAPVYFAFDSYALAPSEASKIDKVAQHLKANASHVLVIEGHCDERGSNEYNLALGENRAQSVRTYMTNLGIAADRIQTRSYGSEKPAVAGSGEAVWRLNRRGEFALYQK